MNEYNTCTFCGKSVKEGGKIKHSFNCRLQETKCQQQEAEIRKQVKVDELLTFEDEIAKSFERGEIKAPVHLHGGNENQLIDIFKHVKDKDWVFSTHRSHYHALLKGVPKHLVKSEILKGNSICLQFSEYRFYTSAIVGGIIPIALGVALAGEQSWCFIGDMGAETGIFHECVKYATGHGLPIYFVVEDNGYSVDTPTDKVWRYSYERRFPHQGTNKGFIVF